jgi:hypothetical protein
MYTLALVRPEKMRIKVVQLGLCMHWLQLDTNMLLVELFAFACLVALDWVLRMDKEKNAGAVLR